MSSQDLGITRGASDFAGVSLVCGGDQIPPTRGVLLGSSNNEIETKEVRAEEKDNVKVDDNRKEEASEIKVKYSLNKVKNLEVAKVNSDRPIKIARLVTDDQNVRYEMNSGQYLLIKDEMLQYSKTQTETTEDGAVTFLVEKNSSVEDVDENNPETQIKMSVTNNTSKEKNNVVIKMYHTNQSIHLQGGKRMGMVTSTYLLADCLEKHWTDYMKENMVGIEETNILLKTMVINTGVTTRARSSSGDPLLNCEHCSYTCALKHQLNTHKISKHGVTVHPITSNKRKSSQTRALITEEHQRKDYLP